MDKLMITLAPTGNVPTKALNPFVPIANTEIVQDLKSCIDYGISIAHLHVRDSDGSPSSDHKIFEDLLNQIKNENLNIITQLSTGVRGGLNTIDYRAQMLDLNCHMASLSTGSSNFPTCVNANSPELIEALALKMKQNHIKPEIEIFDVAMIKTSNYLVKKGILEPNLHFNLVMNVPGSISGNPRNLMFLIESLPQGSTFTVSGIGKSQIEMLTIAILMGGHVRTGLEDVLFLDGMHATNLDLVKQVRTIAKALKREIATVEEAKIILKL